MTYSTIFSMYCCNVQRLCQDAQTLADVDQYTHQCDTTATIITPSYRTTPRHYHQIPRQHPDVATSVYMMAGCYICDIASSYYHVM